MESGPAITVRRITPRDGAILRELRLRSIADAPDAFGQPIEEARSRPQSEWQRSAQRSAHGDNRTWLIAEDGEQAIGLVQGRRRRPRTLLLFSMWVDPTARRSGVGRMLIEALEAWALGWDAGETILWVFGGNASALKFYRDLGFEVIRVGQDAESGARFAALAMRRDIRLPSSRGPGVTRSTGPC
jgi:GNAT superfamily N-acetyltransferase